MSAAHPLSMERILRHGFVDRPTSDVRAATRLTTAIQAQDPLQARLGLRSRGVGFTASDVLAAVEDRSVVKTWLMRGTIHLVTADDVRWLGRLIASSLTSRFAKRWRDLGLTPDVLSSVADALPAVLADGPATKDEIVERLRMRGVTFPMADPQAPYHVLMHATAHGVVCRGPERGRLSTFALLESWLPDAPTGPSGDDAVAELTRRYFTSFAPATAADFTTWSGLPSTAAIALIRDELEATDVQGNPGFRMKDTAPQLPPTGSVRLVAGYDNYVVGYRDRSLLVAEADRPHVYVGGVIKPTVLLDGRVVGIWRLTRTPRTAGVTVTPFEPLSGGTLDKIHAEVEDIARFLEVPVSLDPVVS